MPAIDIQFRRLIRRIKAALPGHTPASRLLRQSGLWRQAPPQQRGAAYVQFYRTQQDLKRIHIEQKILPKIVDLLFRLLRSEPGIKIGLWIAFCALYLILAYGH